MELTLLHSTAQHTKEARDVLCTGKAQMAFLQHTQPRINKAKLQRDKQRDSQRAPSELASSENIQAQCTTPVTFREQMVSSQV